VLRMARKLDPPGEASPRKTTRPETGAPPHGYFLTATSRPVTEVIGQIDDAQTSRARHGARPVDDVRGTDGLREGSTECRPGAAGSFNKRKACGPGIVLVEPRARSSVDRALRRAPRRRIR